MRWRRIKLDPVHGKSKQRLDEVGLLKKECERTRKALPDLLRGHVFRITRNRIDRHLKQCAICRSELDALRHVEETSRIVKDIDLPEGVGHYVREGLFALTKLKIILYRPLWLAGIILAVAGINYYVMQPRQLDIAIENIVGTSLVITSPTPSATVTTEANVVATREKIEAKRRPEPAPVEQPLWVSITPNNETSAITRINRVMGEHARLRKMQFSGAKRKFSGTMTSPELLTFFDRIREVSKVRYDRKRFKSFPIDQQIPFMLTLIAAPETVETPVPVQEPIPEPVQKPVQKPIQSAETYTPTATEPPAPPPTALSPAEDPEGKTPEVPGP